MFHSNSLSWVVLAHFVSAAKFLEQKKITGLYVAHLTRLKRPNKIRWSKPTALVSTPMFIGLQTTSWVTGFSYLNLNPSTFVSLDWSSTSWQETSTLKSTLTHLSLVRRDISFALSSQESLLPPRFLLKVFTKSMKRPTKWSLQRNLLFPALKSSRVSRHGETHKPPFSKSVELHIKHLRVSTMRLRMLTLLIKRHQVTFQSSVSAHCKSRSPCQVWRPHGCQRLWVMLSSITRLGVRRAPPATVLMCLSRWDGLVLWLCRREVSSAVCMLVTDWSVVMRACSLASHQRCRETPRTNQRCQSLLPCKLLKNLQSQILMLRRRMRMRRMSDDVEYFAVQN